MAHLQNELIIILLATILMFLIDSQIKDSSMNWSIKMAVHLQKLPLQTFANTAAIYCSGVIIMCLLFLYLFQGNPKQNLSVLLGCLILAYVSGSPVFYTEKLSMDKCICDHDKPSTKATITTGCLLLYSVMLNENTG